MASNDNGDAEKQKWADFEVVSRYTDQEAVADGTLIPFISNGWDTGHRITARAYGELTEHYRKRGYADYTKADFYRFFFSELLPLVPYAQRKWEQGGIFKTDYNFRVGDWKHSKTLWYVPNEVNGITMMRPEDY